MFYRTDQFDDCNNNFLKYLSSVDSFLCGNLLECKWVIIYLFMFLQSLFLVALSHNNNFSIIKMKYIKTVNKKKYTFLFDLSLQELYKLELENGIIILAPYFGSEEDIGKLIHSLKMNNVSITDKELKEIFMHMNTLLSIKELFNKLKNIVNIDDKFDQSINCLITIRNGFIHFSPKSWAIEIQMLKEIVLNCSELSKFLIESNSIRDYELNKQEMINKLNIIINNFGHCA